jgi:hypothetical protein
LISPFFRLSEGEYSRECRSFARLQYVWADGQEGSENKGLLFNEMHSKTKIVNDHVSKIDDVPQWSYDGRYAHPTFYHFFHSFHARAV